MNIHCAYLKRSTAQSIEIKECWNRYNSATKFCRLPKMIHHQAITRPDIGSVDPLMIIIALIPIKTEIQEVIEAIGQIVNTKPIESILLTLTCRSSCGVIAISSFILS